MEDAFGRRTRCASDTSRWICRVRIARREILVLRERSGSPGIMAHSDERRRGDGSLKLFGGGLLGLLGCGRERHLLPRHEGEPWDQFFRPCHTWGFASVRSREQSRLGSAGISNRSEQKNDPLHTTGYAN